MFKWGEVLKTLHLFQIYSTERTEKAVLVQVYLTITFIPHGSDVVEPLFDRGHSVWRVFVPPPGDLGYGGHRAFQGAARFCHHGVVSQMEVQRLHDVGGLVFGA